MEKEIKEISKVKEKKVSSNPDESWCEKCKKFIYNFKQKKHCHQCGELL